jgi:dinuclear metal center YbgI/SA1388 family protein
MDLTELSRYLDEHLRVHAIRDAPHALNGLQIESRRGRVSRVAAAVDACAATIDMAVAAGADLLLVHHGLFWGGLRPVTGPQYRRLSELVRNDIALYSAHLPLDCHPAVGNNPVLARQLGVSIRGDFGLHQDQLIGVWGELSLARDDLVQRTEKLLGGAPRVLPFGPDHIERVGIVTGAGASAIPQAAAAGLDTLVTGEGPHWTFFDAEELGVNVVLAGHYATETVGVKALAAHLETRFGLPWVFLDHPTGL